MKTKEIMPTRGVKEAPFFPLRGLTEYDSNYKVFVSQCLQTGSVVTADDSETSVQMLTELLEDEISYAIEHKNFTNLFSSPAPSDVWVRWFKASKKNEVRVIELKIDATELRLNEHEVQADVEMAVTS